MAKRQLLKTKKVNNVEKITFHNFALLKTIYNPGLPEQKIFYYFLFIYFISYIHTFKQKQESKNMCNNTSAKIKLISLFLENFLYRLSIRLIFLF